MLMPVKTNESPRAPVDAPSRALTPLLSCVVPALNEHDNLSELLPRLEAMLDDLDVDWEVIVVDDGSSDATAPVMIEKCQRAGFRYVQLSRNFGKEAALSAGLEATVGDVVVCLDADLQHPIELIPRMLERWRAGVDSVYAVRRDRAGEGWFKRVGAAAFYRLLGGDSRVRIPANAGDFRLMDRVVVDALIALPERTRFMKGLYAWVGFTSEPILFDPAPRRFGDTSFSPLRLLSLALDGITAFSTWPLRLLSLFGLVIAVASFGYGLFLIGEYLINGNPVSGWTTVVTTMFFFAGVNMIAFGLLGTYIARIFDEAKQRPLYIVRRSVGRARRNVEVAGWAGR